jgi:hypothetical protein
MWGCTNTCKGGNIFLEFLQRGGANDVFAYTGGTFMECVGVCAITSWPDATNIVVALDDALLDSAPMVTVTGQVPHCIPRVIHQRKTSGDHCIDFFHIILGVIVTTGL